MMRLIFTLFMTLNLILTTACGGGSTTNKDGNYEATKKMVVDILQTEDGKKALRELMTDEEMKKHLIIESDAVQDSINNVLTSEKGTEM